MHRYLDKDELRQFSLPSTMITNNYLNNDASYLKEQCFKNKYLTPMHTRELILQCNNQNIQRQSIKLLDKIINTKRTRHAKALIFDKIWCSKTHLELELKKNWATCLYKFDYRTKFEAIRSDRANASNLQSKLTPISHKEGFEILYYAAENFVSKHRNVKFLISNNNLFTDDFLRLVSILFRRKGVKTVLLQHGGNYQTDANGALVSYEKVLSDYWLGWSSSQIDSPVGIKKIYKKGKPKHILYVPTTNWDVPLLDWSHPYGKKFEAHMEHQSHFFKNLGRKTRELIHVNAEPNDRGFNQYAYYTRYVGGSISKGDLRERVENSRLVISGYSGTVMFHTIASDIPTIMYWDRDLWRWTPEYDDILDILKNANLYFDDGHKLSSFIEREIDQIDAWWRNSKTQVALRKFKEKFRWQSSHRNEVEQLHKWINNIDA